VITLSQASSEYTGKCANKLSKNTDN